MAANFDHFTVPCRDRVASARLLAELLGVPWSETGVGPFSPVYVNEGMTLDFDETTERTSLTSCASGASWKLSRATERVSAALGAEGRVLVRWSGTEPKLRIMLEGPDEARIRAWAKEAGGGGPEGRGPAGLTVRPGASRPREIPL